MASGSIVLFLMVSLPLGILAMKTSPPAGDYEFKESFEGTMKSSLKIMPGDGQWALNEPDPLHPPHKDHTTNTVGGRFLFMRDNTEDTSVKAKLQTTTIRGGKQYCLDFYYIGDTKARLEVHITRQNTGSTLGIYKSDEDKKKSQTETWRRVTLPIISDEPFQLTFLGKRMNGQYPRERFLSLDDIELYKGNCVKERFEVRLVGSMNRMEGYVEIRMDGGEWGPICDNGWSYKEGEVICRELGLEGNRVSRLPDYGKSQNSFIIGELNCKNDAYRILDCEKTSGNATVCRDDQVAKVRCSDFEPFTNNLKWDERNSRMTSSGKAGLLLYRANKNWGYICDKTWTKKEATTACKHLGFNSGRVGQWGNYWKSNASWPIVLDDVSCSQDEVDFDACSRTYGVPPSCGLGNSNYAAAVVCEIGEARVPFSCTFDSPCDFVIGGTGTSLWQTSSGYASIDMNDWRGTGQMVSDLLEVMPESNLCLSFKYQVTDSKNAGRLAVYVQPPSGNRRTVSWVNEYPKSNVWYEALHTIDAEGWMRLRLIFEAEQSMEFSGQLRLDDIRVTNGACEVDAKPEPSGEGEAFKCTFEEDTCDTYLKNETSAQFEWQQWNGRTPSETTGPNDGYLGGYYMYIETSNPRNPNDTAILTTKDRYSGTDRCIRFVYHAKGMHIGDLVILSDTYTLWSLKDPRYPGRYPNKDKWLNAEIDLPADTEGHVRIKGVRGSEYSGDIAIDNFEIVDGFCPK